MGQFLNAIQRRSAQRFEMIEARFDEEMQAKLIAGQYVLRLDGVRPNPDDDVLNHSIAAKNLHERIVPGRDVNLADSCECLVEGQRHLDGKALVLEDASLAGRFFDGERRWLLAPRHFPAWLDRNPDVAGCELDNLVGRHREEAIPPWVLRQTPRAHVRVARG